MRRALLSLLIVACSALPATAGSRPVVSGDPNIDAQWIWQLRKGPDVCGTCTPIDTTGRVRARYRELVVAPHAVVVPGRKVRRVSAPRPAPAQPAEPRSIDAAFLPAVVDYDTHEKPGTIVVDPRARYLYMVLKGGKNNPLGARALYLYRKGNDTMFRIHGSNEPWTIGRAVSSGCFRMRNEDVIELYSRVGVGTKVVVL